MTDSATSQTIRTINPASTDGPERPDYRRSEYRAAADARDLCNALMEGTAAIKRGGERWLPRWPAEKDKHYRIRAAITQVARYYQRTVQASVGMICSTPPKLADGAAEEILKHWEDIDSKGTHGEVFAREVATDAINGGYCGILVDMPPVPEGIKLGLAQEQALGLRPFWVMVPSCRIISWIIDVPDWAALVSDYANGHLTAEQVAAFAKQSVLRQVVIHEPTDVPGGEFGVKSVDRYRVIRLTDAGVSFTVWEKRTSNGQQSGGALGEHFVVVGQGDMLGAKRRPLREIPLAIAYAGRKLAPFVADPPLLALAELNLDHYQVSADRRYLMRLCHAPTLTLIGVEDDARDDGTGQAQKQSVEVGPNSVIRLPVGGDAKYVSADPGALDSSQTEKEELVRQMAALGMSFLGKDRRGQAETATGRALDDAAENASHATVARGLQDGLEQALHFHALYLDNVPAPEITVNTSYAAPTVDPQIASVLWQAVAADKLDVESWIIYVKTGHLPEDVIERLELLKLIAKGIEETETDDVVPKPKSEQSDGAEQEPLESAAA